MRILSFLTILFIGSTAFSALQIEVTGDHTINKKDVVETKTISAKIGEWNRYKLALFETEFKVEKDKSGKPSITYKVFGYEDGKKTQIMSDSQSVDNFGEWIGFEGTMDKTGNRFGFKLTPNLKK